MHPSKTTTAFEGLSVMNPYAAPTESVAGDTRIELWQWWFAAIGNTLVFGPSLLSAEHPIFAAIETYSFWSGFAILVAIVLPCKRLGRCIGRPSTGEQ